MLLTYGQHGVIKLVLQVTHVCVCVICSVALLHCWNVMILHCCLCSSCPYGRPGDNVCGVSTAFWLYNGHGSWSPCLKMHCLRAGDQRQLAAKCLWLIVNTITVQLSLCLSWVFEQFDWCLQQLCTSQVISRYHYALQSQCVCSNVTSGCEYP